jgi:hypothetical protein
MHLVPTPATSEATRALVEPNARSWVPRKATKLWTALVITSKSNSGIAIYKEL